MLLHLFKIIWNKRKENFLLMSEMFFSFVVIFAIFSLLVFYWFNFRKPAGFDYNNVWVVNYTAPENLGGNDSVQLFYNNIKKMLLAFPEVNDISYTSSNVPFSFSTYNNNVSYKGVETMSNYFNAAENYPTIFNVKMISGRWYNRSDNGSRLPPVVINLQLKEKLFGNEEAIGKEITMGDAKYNVVGIAENMKHNGTYQDFENSLFINPDSNALRWNSTILVKVEQGANAEFEGKLFKMLSRSIGTSVEIEHFSKKLATKNKLMQVPLIISVIVAGFLIINVALGLFGVLWYNINKHRGEIGLRRAVGAPTGSIFRQLVAEALVLSTISLLIGTFFAIQFPMLDIFDLNPAIYLTAIGMSVIFIYLLVIICALYPGMQAAAIYPAVALHEE